MVRRLLTSAPRSGHRAVSPVSGLRTGGVSGRRLLTSAPRSVTDPRPTINARTKIPNTDLPGDITPLRNVIYFDSDANGTLADIVDLPYTHVIVCFMLTNDGINVHGDGAAFANGVGNLQGNILKLKAAGKKVLVSLGGDSNTFPSSAWQLIANNWDVDNNTFLILPQIQAFLDQYQFDGIDIDYEDNTGFTPGGAYNGIDFLIELTGQLARYLPAGANIITHAPQVAYWDPNFYLWASSGIVAPYVQVWQQVGDVISWFNNQFYDTPDYDKDAETKVTWYNNIAAITGTNAALVSSILTATDPETGQPIDGYIAFDDMAQNVIKPLISNHGSQFGGVMGWQFAFDIDGNGNVGAWADDMAQALGLPVIIKDPVPPSGSWNVNDLTAATNAQTAAGIPNGYVFTANGVSGMHVVYRGTDGHIYELYWQNGDWNVNDLTAATNAPAAAGDPNGYMFTADNGVSGMHVVYPSPDGQIDELYWAPA